MAEISVQFKNQLNGYNKDEVKLFVKDAEAKLQERAAALANLQQQVSDLEAKLNKLTGGDETVEQKVELYDKLMKKMDGDYENLLAPAIAKAKAIEEQAQKEYELRIDQAKYSAEGIYTETADRISGIVDANMDRMYQLIDGFLYSKTVPGKIKAFLNACANAKKRVCGAVSNASEMPKKVITKVTDKTKGFVDGAKDRVSKAKVALDAYKQRNAEAK